jgi:hypothetical protein
MEIYFAGAIRGGREDAAIYRQIIALLDGYGSVLTEHVGDPGAAEQRLSDDDIYQRDMRWLKQSDVVIAEVTMPSLGVGYEIARAEALGRPILCLHRRGAGHRLSALIGGNPHLRWETYEDLEEAARILDWFFGHVREREASLDQERDTVS